MVIGTLIDTRSLTFMAEPITEIEAATTFRAAVNLFRRWELTDDQAATLLDLWIRTYARWKAGSRAVSGTATEAVRHSARERDQGRSDSHWIGCNRVTNPDLPYRRIG